MPGTVRGQLKQDVAAELGLDYEVDVIAVGSHDTASAVFTVGLGTGCSVFADTDAVLESVSPHWAIKRCKIHKPVMFCKKRILPPTPPSLVKPDSRASSVKTGSSSSIPSNDQVPELKNA